MTLLLLPSGLSIQLPRSHGQLIAFGLSWRHWCWYLRAVTGVTGRAAALGTIYQASVIAPKGGLLLHLASPCVTAASPARNRAATAAILHPRPDRLSPGRHRRWQERQAAARQEAGDGGEDETLQWSVMGVVSCIPLVNWTVSSVHLNPEPYTAESLQDV